LAPVEAAGFQCVEIARTNRASKHDTLTPSGKTRLNSNISCTRWKAEWFAPTFFFHFNESPVASAVEQVAESTGTVAVPMMRPP
jgi:hypothetical protein